MCFLALDFQGYSKSNWRSEAETDWGSRHGQPDCQGVRANLLGSADSRLSSNDRAREGDWDLNTANVVGCGDSNSGDGLGGVG